MNNDKDFYSIERIFSDWDRILEDKIHNKQSRLGSLLESHINALIGAPPAMLANYVLLEYLYPQNPDSHFILFWAVVTWPIFFYLSVGRIYLIRRVFEKFGVSLEPRSLYRYLRNRIKYGYWK